MALDFAFETDELLLKETASILTGAGDPSSQAIDRPIGSVYLQTDGTVWSKVGSGATQWSKVGAIPTSINNPQNGELLQYNGTTGVWENVPAPSGSGDMAKSVYDTDNNGIVDVAESANSVQWTNIQGKPTITAFAETLLDDVSAVDARATLNLGTIATQDANNVSITGGSATDIGITSATITNSSGSSLTVSGSSISGGTISGAGITNGTIDGAAITTGSIQNTTLTNVDLNNARIAVWAPGITYAQNDLVIAIYENESRFFCAKTAHTSSGTTFPGNQSIGTPTDNFAGEWREVSPLRGAVGNVAFEGQLAFSGSITATIGSNRVDNFAPTGIENANFVRLSGGESNRRISGVQAPNPVVAQSIFFCNVGSANLTFQDDSSFSTDVNRLLLGGNRTLNPAEGIQLIYDDVDLRWRSQARNT